MNEFDLRLENLAAVDPVSAEQIRRDTSAQGSRRPVEDTTVPRARVIEWCREVTQEPAPDILVVLGAGRDGEIATLLEHAPEESKVLLLEYEPANAARLVENLPTPIHEHVIDGRLVLALGADERYVETRFLGLVNLRKAPSVKIFDELPADETARAFYHTALKRVTETIHLQAFNIGTMIDRGTLWQHNTLRNLPHLIANPGVAALTNAFEGRPALVLGAGPSLDDTLKILPEYADRFVIIASGTALRPARKAGIRPDLIVTVDGSHKTSPQFATQCDDLFLVCSSLAYPPVLPRFRGLFSASMAANPVSRWLDGFGFPKGDLVAAGTVTTSAMDLAIRMGCDPVLMAGFDLSFEDDGTTHANDTMYHGSKLDPNILIRVPGNTGSDVLTTEQFRCYILLAEAFIEERPETDFVNLTNRGAKIAGLEVASPSELAAFAGEPLDAYAHVNEIHAAYEEDTVGEVRKALDGVLASLRDIGAQAKRAAMICNRLLLMLSRPRQGDDNAARDLFLELEEIDTAIADDNDVSPFIEMSLWPEGYKTGTVRNELEQGYSDANLVMRRSRTLYEQVAGAASWTRDLLVEVTTSMDNEAEAALREEQQ